MEALLPIHITAGALSVLAAVAALTFRKGERAHRTAGTVFVLTMTVMAITAAMLGRDVGNAVGGGLTLYMVWTGWMAGRRKHKAAGALEFIGFLAASAFSLSCFWSAYQVATGAQPAINPYIVYVMCFVGGAVGLAALGDLSVVLRRGVDGPQRIARHLWRMCFGFMIALGSFAAQGSAALPAAFHGPVFVFGPMLLVLALMLVWLGRVLFTRWWTQGARPPAPAEQVAVSSS